MQSRAEKDFLAARGACKEFVPAVWVCAGVGGGLGRCGGVEVQVGLSKRAIKAPHPRNLSLLAVKEAYIPPFPGVSREETDLRGGSGLVVQGTSQSWLPLCPLAAADCDHGSGPWGNGVLQIVSLRPRPAFAEHSQLLI